MKQFFENITASVAKSNNQKALQMGQSHLEQLLENPVDLALLECQRCKDLIQEQRRLFRQYDEQCKVNLWISAGVTLLTTLGAVTLIALLL